MATQQELLIKIRGDIADIQSKLNKVQKNIDKTSVICYDNENESFNCMEVDL